MGKFKPPGLAPWLDTTTHSATEETECPGLIARGDHNWQCLQCDASANPSGDALRQAERSDAAWEAALLSGMDPEPWWAREYLRLWGEALKMNGTPYRTPRRVDKRQIKLELPDG